MRTLLFLPILLLGILFTGCTKKYEYVTPNQTIFFDVATGDWAQTNNNTWIVDLPIPEIDGQVNQDFGIVVSISGDNGATWEVIPEVYGGYTYSYTHYTGHLSLETQIADGSGAGPRPNANIRVKIVLIESQQ